MQAWGLEPQAKATESAPVGDVLGPASHSCEKYPSQGVPDPICGQQLPHRGGHRWSQGAWRRPSQPQTVSWLQGTVWGLLLVGLWPFCAAISSDGQKRTLFTHACRVTEAVRCNAWVKHFQVWLHPGNKLPEYPFLCNIYLFKTTPLSWYFLCLILDLFESNQAKPIPSSKRRVPEMRCGGWPGSLHALWNVGGLDRCAYRGWEHLACSVWVEQTEIPRRQLPRTHAAFALGCFLPCSCNHLWLSFAKLLITAVVGGGGQYAVAL